MIYSLKGKLALREMGLAVIECGGVGYKCGISMSTLEHLPPVGQEAFLFTHLAVSQDNVALYGFATREELSCFRMLTGVSGIGAKTAVEVLSALSPEQIAVAVASGDYKTLTRAKGVGPKQAQRIALELRDKVTSLGAPDIIQGPAGTAGFSPASKTSEAVSALMVLGCSADEAAKLVAQIDAALPVEQIISGALKLLGERPR